MTSSALSLLWEGQPVGLPVAVLREPNQVPGKLGDAFASWVAEVQIPSGFLALV